jgi:hypothetical protein
MIPANRNDAVARIEAQEAIDARSEIYDHPETGLKPFSNKLKPPSPANSSAAAANSKWWRAYGTDEGRNSRTNPLFPLQS